MAENERVLIDVLAGDSFEREHLPGAVNFCVYETAFVSKVTEAFPERKTPLTVCGYSNSTREAELAVMKLKEAGYDNVTALEGGLERWMETGKSVEGSGNEPRPADGRKEIDLESSLIRWTGRNLFNFHTGDLKLKGGFVELKNGAPTAAEFRIDMESIGCSDLTDSKMNRMLIEHLRTDDFFDVAHYPEATLVISAAEPIEGVTDGLPNHRVKADLTLRGTSQPLEFAALVAWKDDGSCVAQAVLDFDRTRWGSIYGSGRFFSRLGQHVVNDLVHLHVKVATLP